MTGPFSILVMLMASLVALYPSTSPAQDKNGDDETLYLTFDDVKFEMEKDEEFERDMLTDEINDMRGKRISIIHENIPNYPSNVPNSLHDTLYH